MTGSQKLITSAVLLLWLAGMVTVGRNYENTTLMKLPVLAWAVGQNRLEILAWGEYYEVPLDRQDVLLKSLAEYRTAISDRFDQASNYFDDHRTIITKPLP